MVMVPLGPYARLDEVVRILRLVAEKPGRRSRPRPGDREGSFDEWFDGGACAHTTDVTRFELDDGSEAWLSTSSPVLKGGVRLASGEVVDFEQRHAAAPPPSGAAEGACVVCGGAILPGETHAFTPRGPAHARCL